MKVTGKVRIFESEFNGRKNYSTSISNKKEDGTYENMFIPVGFKKGEETSGNIEVKDGFLTFFKTSTGLPKIKIVILDYEKDFESDFISVEDPNDLPF